MSKIVRFIGIDFGTSTSVVSYMDYEKKGDELVPSHNLNGIAYSSRSTLIPTIIWANAQGSELYGTDIQPAMLIQQPDLIKKEFKMRLGSAVSQESKSKAIESTYKFFEYLYRGYVKHEKAQNSDITERRVYVSYPAKWETEQKSLTIDAAYEAFKEFPEVRDKGIYSIDEPTAALHYIIHSKDVAGKAGDELRINNQSIVLVIDMGAGTTDLVLYAYNPQKPSKVLAKYPEPGRRSTTFGGREIDNIFSQHFKEEFPEKLKGVDEEEDEGFRLECKGWKEQASNLFNNGVYEEVPFLPSSLGRSIKPKGYDKDRICWLLRDYLPQFPELVNSIVEIAKNNSEDFSNNPEIDFVVLTGGHSRWFFVEEMLKGKWVPGLPGDENLGSGINLPKIQAENWRLIRTGHPQHIVSYGLCMSGIPIEVIQLSNSDVWLDIELGDSSSKKERIVKRNIRLPHKRKLSKEFNCKIGSEDFYIPVIITPIIGVKGDDYLDSVKIEVGTNLFSDFVNIFSEGKYRVETVEVDLTCKFDENQLFSFEGKISTPGILGFEEEIAMSPTEVAKNILAHV